jgi:hypothetical protein
VRHRHEAEKKNCHEVPPQGGRKRIAVRRRRKAGEKELP